MADDFNLKMKNALLDLKKEIVNTLSENNAAFRRMIEGAEGQDDIDIATDAIDTQMLDAMGSKDLNRMKLIDSALMRIEQGKYGICMKCGKPIPHERLEALPYALLCVNCKSNDERRNR